MRRLLSLAFAGTLFLNACAQKNIATNPANAVVKPGAERMEQYLPELLNKRVAVFANPTSMVGNRHLVDTLLALGVKVKVIFGPEHGFRGDADAGEKVGNAVDPKTGIPVVSLYGKKNRPDAEDLKDIDVMLFDIQDVGVRFYTYINSMQHYMESAIEFNKYMILLDRPNPNGFYVDGPVLKPQFKSGVGLQPVPIVYGMTIGEYAQMLMGERWLDAKSNEQLDRLMTMRCMPGACFQFRVVENENYNHKTLYTLPVAPSPNLKEMQSIYLYPSTCFFEGTPFSEGRGTEHPFQIFGHPSLPRNLFEFTPKPNVGAKNSKNYFQKCYGWNLNAPVNKVLKEVDGKIQLKWFLNAYKLFPQKDSFFLKGMFINKLAGTEEFAQQVKAGKSEAEIRQSWQKDLQAFKVIRKKYLIYPDFE